MEEPSPTPARAKVNIDCEILNMVRTLNEAIAAVSQDTARIQRAYAHIMHIFCNAPGPEAYHAIKDSFIQRAYDQLRVENIARDKALTDLSEIVKEYGSPPVHMRPNPVLQADVLDEEGNLRAADIGITWENKETFLHGVRVVGPGPPRPTGMGPVIADADIQIHRPPAETRQGYRPAAPIQRFNKKSLNWPAWFRHFRAVADVHGWSKDQRALQLVSYLDEAAINVAQELGGNELYNYDVLVKLLSDRFDPASRVSAFRSRFHGRSRRHP